MLAISLLDWQNLANFYVIAPFPEQQCSPVQSFILRGYWVVTHFKEVLRIARFLMVCFSGRDRVNSGQNDMTKVIGGVVKGGVPLKVVDEVWNIR